MIRWRWANLQELTGTEVYEVLALRQRVFVLEQKCLYLDADGRDRSAWHLLGWSDPSSENAEKPPVLAAYLRVLPPGTRFTEHSIGRVVTAPEHRGKGLAREMMLAALNGLQARVGPVPIRLSAQAHLEAFYQSLGYVTQSAPYLEDDIPHLDMLYTPP